MKSILSTIKRLIKPFALSFFQSEWLISWPVLCISIKLNQICLLKMTTNSFVYWSDGLGGRAFDHQSRNEGPGIYQQKLAAGPGIWIFFQMLGVCPGVCPEGGCSRLELPRTLICTYLLSWERLCNRLINFLGKKSIFCDKQFSLRVKHRSKALLWERNIPLVIEQWQ